MEPQELKRNYSIKKQEDGTTIIRYRTTRKSTKLWNTETIIINLKEL